MSANLMTNQIVDRMEYYWTFAVAPNPNPTFHFGWPQEVDNIHNKVLPLMVLNPPEITVSTMDWNKNHILNNSNWTLITYEGLPRDYNVTDDLKILELWDSMENDLFNWFYNWWYYYENQLGIEFVLTSPIKITRMKEASNDRMLALKVTFGFDFYRYCATTTDYPNVG
tara:strand:+ start:245 stop:751 length:507 start_codon:yes stop_codon:yes gene_type:complete